MYTTRSTSVLSLTPMSLSFLDESRNTDLIRWSESGDSFIVVDEDEFAKTLIPELFKHNNYASFVRQLNMYGFHKKVGLSDNSMRASERKNKSPSEYWNPYFKRGRPNLLWLVQKPKNPQNKGGGKGGGRIKPEDGNLEDEGEDALDSDFPANVNSVFPEHVQAGRQPLMIGQGGRPPQDAQARPERRGFGRHDRLLSEAQLDGRIGRDRPTEARGARLSGGRLRRAARQFVRPSRIHDAVALLDRRAPRPHRAEAHGHDRDAAARRGLTRWA